MLNGFKDRVGLGWRPKLAAGILAHLDRIDVVEVIADDFFKASRRDRRALQTLAMQVPITLHGVTLGMASSVPVDAKRLGQMASLCDQVQPVSWSEHLAFVRGGGVEIGHLAAPPRNRATIDGAIRNLIRAKEIVGVAPLVENVATLIDPPGSELNEAPWIAEILRGSKGDMLLDLHNLYANALNFKFNPNEFLSLIPADRISSIHLAGGKWIGGSEGRRLLDDHLHDVPEPVYDLLAAVGAYCPRPLTVILERDGHFPSIESLLQELDRARLALAAGRARQNVAGRSEVAA